MSPTLTPGTSTKIIKKNFHRQLNKKNFFYAVAPRRDWFVDNSKNLTKMDRVFGGYNESHLSLQKFYP